MVARIQALIWAVRSEKSLPAHSLLQHSFVRITLDIWYQLPDRSAYIDTAWIAIFKQYQP